MGAIVGAALSSHAYTFQEPATWDTRRARSRAFYRNRYGHEAPAFPDAMLESFEDIARRYQHISEGLERVRAAFAELAPDVLVVIGDDQDENFHEDNLPQLSLYTGTAFEMLERRDKPESLRRYSNDAELAAHLLAYGVERGFDIASSACFRDNRLISHAHCEPLRFLKLSPDCRVLPIFVNGIHVPAPTPRRCYDFGVMLRDAIDSASGARRVVVYASGGMSHYSPGFSWAHYAGTNTIGSISTAFDRAFIDALRTGNGASTAHLTSQELIDHGDIEMRQGIILAGMLGSARPAFITYEPFHRAIMGMAVGYWELAS